MNGIDIRLCDAREAIAGLGDESIHLVLTDPPYGHNNNNNGDLISRWEEALGKVCSPKSEWRPILNDGVEANDLLLATLPQYRRVLVKGGALCCCGGGGGPNPQFARWSLWIDGVLDFKQMVVWDKGPMGMGWHYRRSYETVLVATKPGAKCRWYDDSHKVENIIRPGHNGIRKIIPRKHQHPCAKPVALAEHFIRLHTMPGDTVLDPFMGAGWVGEAAVRLGRRFVGFELDKHWYDVASERLLALLPISEEAA